MADQDLRLRMIFSALDKVTAPMRGISTGSRAMAKEIKASSTELDRLNAVQSRITGFRTLKGQLRDTARDLAAAETKVTSLAKAIGAVDTPTKKMNAEFNRAKKEAGALKDKHDGQRTALQTLRGELNNAGVSTVKLVGDQSKLRTEMARVTTHIDEQKVKLGQLADKEAKIAGGRAALDKSQATASNMAVGGAAAMGTGIAIGAPLVAASKEAMTFESRMIDIKKVMNDVSPVQLQKIEAGLLKMSTQGPIAADGLGRIAAEGARAGIAAKDLLPFTQGAMKMAAAFDIAAEDAGAMQAKWQTGLGLTIPQITVLGDKVNALTNTFGGNAAAVTDMITRVGPLGKIAGVASGEMAAMASLLNKVGVESEIGATGIKRMMLTLTVGEAATKSQSAAYARLGLDAVAMSKKMQVDARGGILSVLDAINQLPKEQQAGVLTQLFGSESVASIAPMLSSLDQLKANFGLVGDQAKYAGSMNREFDVAMSKSENQVSATGNSLNVLQTVVGKQLIPAIKTGAGWVKTIAVGLAGWAGEHPMLIKVLGITLGVIAGLLIVVGGLAIGIAGLIGPFAMLRYAMLMTRVQWVAMMGVMKGQRMLAAVGWLKAVGSSALTMGRNALVGLAGYARLAAGMAVGGLKTVAAALLSVGRAALIMGRAFLLNPVTLIITAIAVGAYLIYRYWGPISNFFSTLWGGVTKFFSNAWSNIKAGVQIGWSAIKALFFNYHPIGLIYTHWSGITAWFGSLWARVKGVFSGAWAGIKGMMSGWGASMWSIGSKIINGIANGIRSAPGAVWEALKSVVFGGINRIKAFIGLGPSGGGKAATATGPKIAGARALGGPVSAGRTYLVGERGPELFTAPFGGMITANNKLRQMAKLATIGGGAAMLSAGPALAAPRSSIDGAGGGNQYSISLHFDGGAAGVDERRIAAAVQQAIAEIEREHSAQKRSSYRDDA